MKRCDDSQLWIRGNGSKRRIRQAISSFAARSIACVSALMLGLLVLVGCGSSSKATGGGKLNPPPKSSYALSDLPQAEFNLPEVDEGRVRIPTPATWRSGSRRSDLLVWFYYRDRNGMPRILVRARDAASEFRNTTADNIEAYAAATMARLESEPALLEPVKVMTLGEQPCLRYVLAGRTEQGAAIDRQFLLVTHQGREYEIEMQVLGGTIHQFKTAAYTVMAQLKFANGNGSSASGGGTSTGSTEEPATKEPATEVPAKQ